MSNKDNKDADGDAIENELDWETRD